MTQSLAQPQLDCLKYLTSATFSTSIEALIRETAINNK